MTRRKVVLVDYDPELFDLTPAVLAEMRETLAGASATLEIGRQRSEAAVLALAGAADIIMIQSLRPLLNGRVIPQLARCRGIIRLGLGYDSVDVAAASAAGIPVSNVVAWCDDEVAEHAIALLFACARRLATLDRLMRQGQWAKEAAAPIGRLAGKTLGLVAFGRIARAVARKLGGFGLDILAWSESASPEEARAYGVELVSLEVLLRRSDYVSIHSAVTTQRRHLIGAAQLSLLKPGAILINTSRGALVDEAALAAALAAGPLGFAGLDVFEQEPLAPDSPLLAYDNVLITPHIASYSREAVETLYRKSAAIAADLLQGRRVDTIVNPEVRAHV